MLQFIYKLFSSTPKLKLQHPVFGNIQLELGAKGPYWLHEAYTDGELTIAIYTVGKDPPTEAQVQLFQQVLARLDDTYELVADELSAMHQEMHSKPIQADWHQTFQLTGIDVPLNGNKNLSWEITFECLTDNSGFLYTCHFENGTLVDISIDT